MLSIRCFKCGWAWSMNSAEVAAALNGMHAEQRTKYYMAECPKCRRANKVAIRQLRRYVPRDWKPTPVEKAADAKADAKTPAKDTPTAGKADKPTPKTAGKAKPKAKTTNKAKPKGK